MKGKEVQKRAENYKTVVVTGAGLIDIEIDYVLKKSFKCNNK